MVPHESARRVKDGLLEVANTEGRGASDLRSHRWAGGGMDGLVDCCVALDTQGFVPPTRRWVMVRGTGSQVASHYEDGRGAITEPLRYARATDHQRGVVAMTPRAFISFEMEDQWSRSFLVQHARAKNNDIRFVDYSVKNAWDSAWKTNCRLRISQTKGTIVMIGATTHASDAVLWEIEETKRQGHYLFGIQINSDETHRLPAGIPAASIIRWDFEQIVSWLNTWT